ncbi:hypothetical protein F7725_017196 [Dissostichus mawsoni]|uniref:Uncharacterized protein n=1 Tax=Dissostichus mawsoni TaxID=36200 RepID=A0A7J5Z4P6_DISMA|nr:hypothetical protein F7725_017196 [Dissostichus mawsoni]
MYTKTLYVIQDVPREEQSSSGSTEEEEKEEVACILSVGPFWYVSNIYKKEMERIEKENGVKIIADLKITFEARKMEAQKKLSLSLQASSRNPEELKEVMKPEEWEQAFAHSNA